MRYAGGRWQLDLPLPSLLGAHQIANAGTAIACLEQLSGFRSAAKRSPPGLRHIEWPARLQRLTHGPLIEMMPSGWEFWLDGGHNPGGRRGPWRCRGRLARPPALSVVGMMNTKDAAGFLAPLAPHAKALDGVTIPGEENPLPAETIAATARSVGMTAMTATSVSAAVADFVRDLPTGRVLICGSLHFAGTVLHDNS